jgi:hypothetical protein
VQSFAFGDDMFVDLSQKRGNHDPDLLAFDKSSEQQILGTGFRVHRDQACHG